jgi:hypothetical protein
MPTTMAYGFHRHLIEMLRADALRRWRPRPLNVPTRISLSDVRLLGASADYGWSDLQALPCARLPDAVRAAGWPPASLPESPDPTSTGAGACAAADRPL